MNKPESTCLNYLNDFKDFVKYSDDLNDIYKNIEECNPNKKRKILIVFDDMIADMPSNKKLNLVLYELFIRGRKLNISLFFYYVILFFCSEKNWTKFYSKDSFNKLD